MDEDSGMIAVIGGMSQVHPPSEARRFRKRTKRLRKRVWRALQRIDRALAGLAEFQASANAKE